MIQPLQAIASRTMMSNPFANSANSVKAYNSNMNYMSKGEKLNINCEEVRSLTRNGKKLDLYA